MPNGFSGSSDNKPLSLSLRLSRIGQENVGEFQGRAAQGLAFAGENAVVLRREVQWSVEVDQHTAGQVRLDHAWGSIPIIGPPSNTLRKVCMEMVSMVLRGTATPASANARSMRPRIGVPLG